MISLRVSVGGNFREIETTAQSLDDLEIPLEMWNKYKRKKVQETFDSGGPGWPPKETAAGDGGEGRSSEALVRKRADQILRVKLQKELKRAQRKYVNAKSNASKSAAAMNRRYAVLKEFERLAAGGEPSGASTGDAKLDASVHRLRERHARASVKAASRPLGRIAASIKSKVAKYSVEIKSSIPWAGAHNDGDTVGHGAELPQRQFLDVTEEDLAVLLILITTYVQRR